MENNKFIPNIPKTYEQFVLEEQQLASERQQDLYPDLVHEDVSIKSFPNGLKGGCCH